MARWDQILTLPVQNPPTLEFSASDLTWSRIEGWKETMDKLALIPFSRVSDFLRGESNNKDYPTRFHVEARRKRSSHSSCKPKVDGILEYIMYWCSFGPDDHRKGGLVRPSRVYTPKRKTPAGRPNTKQGCTCHFIVKRLVAEPSVALIIYNKDKHVDKNGLPCHGLMDSKSAGTRAMFAPFISDELRIRILSLLHVGVPVETIMQRHIEGVEKNGGPSNRDDLLTHRCVRRMERKIRRETHELDLDDAISVKLWVQNNQNQVFFYEDFSNSDTFTLGIQTEWQLEQMIRFGNRRLIASDSKFGTNKLKCPVYSLVVFDMENNAIPIAWVITPNYANGGIYKWIGSLYYRVRTKDPSWQLGGFIIDDPLTDTFIIREVFQCSVLISFWRVRHAWHKNILKKCSKIEARTEIFKRLGEILYKVCSDNGDISLFETFLQDFSHCSEFSEYFKATWFPRLGVWIKALKSYPISTLEISSALENYHNLLKLRLINETDSDLYQRTDWVVHKLGTKVHSFFWLDEFSEKDSFSRYWRTEWRRGSTAFNESLKISIGDVTIENNCARVVCQEVEREKVVLVRNPGTEFALCDCGWSKEGYICKHVVRMIRVCREKGLAGKSLSMVCYERALKSVLDCVPVDSLVRDHAVGLTVRVRAQLGSLFGTYGDEREIKIERESASKEKDNETERRNEVSEKDNGMNLDANSTPMDVDESEENKDETKENASLEEISEKVKGVSENEKDLLEGSTDERSNNNGMVDENKKTLLEGSIDGKVNDGMNLDETTGMQNLQKSKDIENSSDCANTKNADVANILAS